MIVLKDFLSNVFYLQLVVQSLGLKNHLSPVTGVSVAMILQAQAITQFTMAKSCAVFFSKKRHQSWRTRTIMFPEDDGLEPITHPNKQKMQKKQNDIYKNTTMKCYNIRCGEWYAQVIWQPIRHPALSILQTKDSGGRRKH